MPFVRGDDLLFVYTPDPLVILRVDPETLEASEHERSPSSDLLELTMLRGSSQVLPWEGGFLFVTHEAYDYKDSFGRRRRYLHRFVHLDEDLTVRRVTEPFHFLRPGIEFCAGIAQVGDSLVLSFGVDDERAMLAIVPQSEVAQQLTTMPGGRGR